MQKCNSDLDFWLREQQTLLLRCLHMVLLFSLAINVQTKITGKKLACTYRVVQKNGPPGLF